MFLFFSLFYARAESITPSEFEAKRSEIKKEIESYQGEIKRLKELRSILMEDSHQNYIASKDLYKERDDYYKELRSWRKFLQDKGGKDYGLNEIDLKNAISDLEKGCLKNPKGINNYEIAAKSILSLEFKNIEIPNLPNYEKLNEYDKKCVSTEYWSLLKNNAADFLLKYNLKEPIDPGYSKLDKNRLESKDIEKKLDSNGEKIDDLCDKIDHLCDDLDKLHEDFKKSLNDNVKPPRSKHGSVTIGSDGSVYRTINLD